MLYVIRIAYNIYCHICYCTYKLYHLHLTYNKIHYNPQTITYINNLCRNTHFCRLQTYSYCKFGYVQGFFKSHKWQTESELVGEKCWICIISQTSQSCSHGGRKNAIIQLMKCLLGSKLLFYPPWAMKSSELLICWKVPRLQRHLDM